MIIVFHHNNKITSVYDYQQEKNISVDNNKTIFSILKILATQNPTKNIGWCNEALKENINFNAWESIFHHQQIWASYSLDPNFCFHKNLGYVDQSIFINVNTNNTYPTWISSTDIGATSAYVFNQITIENQEKYSFRYVLNTIAKTIMPLGVFCYSEPKLITSATQNTTQEKEITETELLTFISTFYKKSWLFIYLLNSFIYESRLPILKFIKSRIQRKIKISVLPFTQQVQSNKTPIKKEAFTVDVIIPTLERKKYLYDVLQDLAKQKLLPKKVIIVEQNADENGTSELDYLKESWPFKIDHTFTHQLGACNARNIALSKATNNWLFFADDDIRLEENLLQNCLQAINTYGTDSLLMSCPQKGELVKSTIISQTTLFASGASIINAKVIKGIKFKKEHEHGFGEDVDFGMQIRHKGYDLISFPQIKMLHLKAPSGGFRFNYVQKWYVEAVQPKPTPTMMAFNLKHLTKQQLYGYKTILFIKHYRTQSIKNPIKYLKSMNAQWQKSVYWAKQLMLENKNI